MLTVATGRAFNTRDVNSGSVEFGHLENSVQFVGVTNVDVLLLTEQ